MTLQFRRAILAGLCALAVSAAAVAQTSYGTAEEARAMLEKAVSMLKINKATALDMFNAPDGPFRDRDLYVFCVNASDGMETAHPTHKGMDITKMKDADGFAFGQAIMDTATEGEIKEVAYRWPRPGSEVPAKKITFVTKVADQICAVGYYP